MHDRASLLLQWARRISGDANLSLTLISGDASFRRYFRGGGLVWVDANPKTEKNHEFVRNAAALHAVGLLAPEVRAVDYEQGLLAVTDLGDTQLIGCLNDDNVLAWYGKAIALQCDVSDHAAVKDMVAKAAAELGPIGVLVNNAGNAGANPSAELGKPFWETNPEVWNSFIE